MDKKPRINNIEFRKAPRGWICEINFRVHTHRQCTMECHAVRGGAKGHGLISMLKAYRDARKNVKAEIIKLQALPGEF